MNREQFEALKPILGSTPAYQIFAMQSDNFLASNDIRKINRKYRIVIEHHEKACLIVDSLELYCKFLLTDEYTYIRLIATAARYLPPVTKMSRELCRRIISVRPDFIPLVPNSYINTQLYLKYIIEHDLKDFSKMAATHFRNKEFLFYCWKKSPRLLLQKRFQHLWTNELLIEFDQLYPKLNIRKIYSLKPPKAPRIYVTREDLENSLKRGEIPSARILSKLFTPKNVEAIINIDPEYMLFSAYRKRHITRDLFRTYYIHLMESFPQYLDAELLEELYESHSLFYIKYIRIYNIETLHRIMDENKEYIGLIHDKYIIGAILDKNMALFPYVREDLLFSSLF